MSLKKNLVIGSGKGYNWYILEPFIRSFAKYFENTDLVLFLADTSDFTLHQIKMVGKELCGGEIKIEPFPENLTFHHPANARWQMFSDYVSKNGCNYDQIFISDTRDLFFQSDVFKCFKDQSKYLACAVEDFAGPIGYYRGTRFKFLYDEVVKVFGKEEAEKLSDKLNFAPSTIAGTSKEIEIFLNKMYEYMPKNFDFYTLDALTEWYILYNNLVPVENIIEVRCLDGSMLSADWFFKLNPIEIKDNFVLCEENNIPAVVHQYDRHELLQDLADRVYRKPLEQPDERFTDAKSCFEQMLHLVRNENLDVALKFFIEKLSEEKNFSEAANYFIGYWETILKKADLDFNGRILNTAVQYALISAVGDNLYTNQGITICRCLKLCRKNNYTIISGFEDWLKQKAIKAVKWHYEHSNFPRYHSCIQLLTNLNLIDNMYYYFIKADIFRSEGMREEAAKYYTEALKYQYEDKFTIQKLTALYWEKMIDETKFFIEPKPTIIQPFVDKNDSDLVFDENFKIFVRKNKNS